jgi:hypothetical protein
MNPITRQLRIIQVAMIVSVGLFYYVRSTTPPAAHKLNPTVQWAIVSCAVASALMGFIVQRILARSPGTSHPGSQISARFSPWFAGHILRFATAESVALFGFVLHTLGGPPVLVNCLFAGAMLLLLLWQPGTIPAPTVSQSSIG